MVHITNKKILYITAGSFLLLTTIILPLALIFPKSSVEFVDLHLSDNLPKYYSIQYTQNRLQIKINDEFSDKFFIKKVFMPNETTVFEIEGNKSAVINIKFSGDTFKFNILDIEKSTYTEYDGIHIEDDNSWILYAIGLVKPFPRVEVDYSIEKVNFRISEKMPLNYILVNSIDGVYFALDGIINLSSIGNVYVDEDFVPLPKGSKLRTVHINTQYILSVIDLYDGYYKISYSKFVDPVKLPVSISSVISISSAFKTVSLKEFFMQYIYTISDYKNMYRSELVKFCLDLSSKNVFADIDVLMLNGYIYMYTPNPNYNIGALTVGETVLYQGDPISRSRAVLLKNISGEWYAMVVDVYPHFDMINRGLSPLKKMNGMDLFLENLNRVYLKKFNHKLPDATSKQLTTLSDGIKELELIFGSFDESPIDVYNIRILTDSALTQKYLKEYASIIMDIDLDVDVLPPEVECITGDLLLLTTLDLKKLDFKIIGRVKWGEHIIEPKATTLLRSILILHVNTGYVFCVIDVDIYAKINVPGIYRAPDKLPKWIKPLPIIPIIGLKEPLSWGISTIRYFAKQTFIKNKSLTNPGVGNPNLSEGVVPSDEHISSPSQIQLLSPLATPFQVIHLNQSTKQPTNQSTNQSTKQYNGR